MCGKNRAHSSFPHITLCQYFTCEDRKIEGLYKALQMAGDNSSFPQTISLSLYSSASFIGFFINKHQAGAIRSFVEAFCSLASTHADCSIRLVSREFHLTLAHKFSPHLQGTLECLAKSICPTQNCVWEATLYSRDMRFVHYQTLRAVFPFSPVNEDELTLRQEDYVFVDPSQIPHSPQGWLMAVSHRTGSWGLVPENYLERTSETVTWIQHRCYRFLPGPEQPADQPESDGERRDRKPPITQVTPPRILLLCHAESVDEVFGPRWLTERALNNGVYSRTDLNLPVKVPHRKDVRDLEKDPPLSSCGTFQAQVFGEALHESLVKCSAMFSSPALCCIQTAQQIVEGMTLQHQVKICVDQRLCDWIQSSDRPHFMDKEDLERGGYNVDVDYRTSSLPEEPQTPMESAMQFLQSIYRHTGGTENSGDSEKNKGITIIVGSSSYLLPLSRIILGFPPQQGKGSAGCNMKIPPLASCLCEKVSEGRWAMMEPLLKNFTHSSSHPVQWDDLL